MRHYMIIDIESAVTDPTAHQRYRNMERYVPGPADEYVRQGRAAADRELQSPRWPFQTIAAACVMHCIEHDQGGIEPVEMTTWSADRFDERGIVAGVLHALATAPEATELVSWQGAWADIPHLIRAAAQHGLTLPKGWGWLAFTGEGRVPHIDLARCFSGGAKMKQIHMTEFAAALNIPSKMTLAPYAVAENILAGQHELVAEAVEGDVITTAMLLGSWRRLIDPRGSLFGCHDRIVRRTIEMRPNRSYVADLEAWRRDRTKEAMHAANDDGIVLAPQLFEAA
jgi:3'-5' exonuclease